MIATAPLGCPTSLKSWPPTSSVKPKAPNGRGTAIVKKVRGAIRKCWVSVVVIRVEKSILPMIKRTSTLSPWLITESPSPASTTSSRRR